MPNEYTEFVVSPTLRGGTTQQKLEEEIYQAASTNDYSVYAAFVDTYKYGAYCGPGWSDNQLQDSVVGLTQPVDQLDALCKVHDGAFAIGTDIKAANDEFVSNAYTMGTPRSMLYAFAVGTTRMGEQRLRGTFSASADETVLNNNNNYYSLNSTMPKKSKTGKQNKQVKQKPKGKAMQPVSTVTTAPVSIGNTLRGYSPVVTQNGAGLNIQGRDFAFACSATVAANVDWTPTGGMPITPAACPSTALKSYCQLYAKFRVNRLVVHYITSSPTSQAGDVLFYYERDRMSPMVDITNNNFLPFIISDPYTVMGPQWTNHTMMIKGDGAYRSTNYGLNADLNEDAMGTLFLFSKTTSASSPGYVIFDYDITFSNLSINPRSGMLPIARASYTYFTVGRTATAVTSGSTLATPVVQGINPDGTSSALPTGHVNGDVYKFIALPKTSVVSGVNAAWLNINTSNLLLTQLPAANSIAASVDDGFTCYLSIVGSSVFMYPTLSCALTGTQQYYYGVTATVTWNLCGIVSLVGGISTLTTSSY